MYLIFPTPVIEQLVTEYKDELKRKNDQDSLIQALKNFEADKDRQSVVHSPCSSCPAGLIQQVRTKSGYIPESENLELAMLEA